MAAVAWQCEETGEGSRGSRRTRRGDLPSADPLVQAFAFSPEPMLVPVVSVLRGAFGVEDPNLLAPGMDLAWWRRLVAPAIGGLLVGPIVHLLAREAKGHGVPAVMEAVAVRGGMIRPRVAW